MLADARCMCNVVRIGACRCYALRTTWQQAACRQAAWVHTTWQLACLHAADQKVQTDDAQDLLGPNGSRAHI